MPTLVLLWVWFCAYLNCAGWTLSALHQLNADGYAVALALRVRRAAGLAKEKLPRKLFPPFAGRNISADSAAHFHWRF